MALIKKFRIKKFKTKSPIASIRNISITFQKRQILDDININFNSGEIIGLLGPNGAGKSTIFNLIMGLIKPDYGKILINDFEVTNFPVHLRSKKFNLGFVPQYGGYFHDLTLYQNLKAVGEILIDDRREREIKINQLISKFKLENIQEIKAKFLSGGQRRKLVIAMALMSNPKILMCDEIFAALDLMTIQMIKEILVNLQIENPELCIIVCEHQARELLSIVDRALILSECKIVAEGSPSALIKNEKAKIHYFGNSF
jgi:lipopolysaccharide export system ATP-binding protein